MTMNFSRPDDVKYPFNRTFPCEYKSALVTKLMQEEIAQAERKARYKAGGVSSDAASPSALCSWHRSTSVGT